MALEFLTAQSCGILHRALNPFRCANVKKDLMSSGSKCVNDQRIMFCKEQPHSLADLPASDIHFIYPALFHFKGAHPISIVGLAARGESSSR